MPHSWRRALLVMVLAFTGAMLAASGAWASGDLPGVTVGGAVGAPAAYSQAQLRALPQTTAEIARPGHRPLTVTGVSLEDLVKLSQPVLPAVKNALLRVTLTVAGGGRVTVALGELDPKFGDHPAILALEENGSPVFAGPDLVFPGDTSDARSVMPARRITVAVENLVAVAVPSGALEIEHGARAVILSAALLASLPTETLSVAFFGPGGLQHHTETGPTLDTVLAAAGIRPDANTWVAGVGSDGYVATVTPAEATVGGRPLLIATSQDGVALARPRLVADGDVKGGRYVSDLVALVVGEGDRAPTCALAPPGCRILAPAPA